MTDTMTHGVVNSQSNLPRYQVAEVGTPDSVANWLNSLPDYEFVSMTAISVTNHFSKETETTVWVVAKLRGS